LYNFQNLKLSKFCHKNTTKRHAKRLPTLL